VLLPNRNLAKIGAVQMRLAGICVVTAVGIFGALAGAADAAWGAANGNELQRIMALPGITATQSGISAIQCAKEPHSTARLAQASVEGSCERPNSENALRCQQNNTINNYWPKPQPPPTTSNIWSDHPDTQSRIDHLPPK
jgi:hypothetical protein